MSSSNIELIPKEVGLALLGEFLNSRREDRAQQQQSDAMNNMFQDLSRTQLAGPGSGEQLGPTVAAAQSANERFNMPELKAMAGVDPAGVVRSLIEFTKPLTQKDRQALDKGAADIRKTEVDTEKAMQGMAYDEKSNALNLYNKDLSNRMLAKNINAVDYVEREVPKPDGGWQYEESKDGGRTFQPIGISYKKGSNDYRPYFQFLGVDPSSGDHLIGNARNGEITNARTGEQYTTGQIKPGKLRPLPDGAITSLETFGTLLGSARSIIATVKEHPEFTGPIEGRLNMFQAKYRNMPEFAAFQREMYGLIEISYALSGKAISEKEIVKLERLRGQIANPDENFGAEMVGFSDWVSKKLEGRAAEYENQGYIVPKMYGGRGFDDVEIPGSKDALSGEVDGFKYTITAKPTK
jgi:hypothetical protein